MRHSEGTTLAQGRANGQTSRTAVGHRYNRNRRATNSRNNAQTALTPLSGTNLQTMPIY